MKMPDLRFGEITGLAGKTAVITGGAGNLGGAMSRRLGAAGVNIALVYQNSETAAEDAVRSINASGGTAAAYRADVSDEDAVVKLFAAVEADERFAGVDILINNSAVFSVRGQGELAAAEWERTFAVNTLGIFLCSREAAAMMKRKRSPEKSGCRGVIINISSTNALHPGFGGTAHYDASKGAVSAYTRSLAAELGPSGIRVNAVAPGLIDSPGLRSGASELAEDVARRSPLADSRGGKHLVSAEDASDAVMYLASDMASSVTGEVLVIDRGFLLT